MSQPAISQHLRVLKEAKLVRAKKIGYWMHYEVDSISLESRGKALVQLFGGWVKPEKTGDGTANCPEKLLKECRALSQNSQEIRHLKEVKKDV